jgi:hypothetical protein
MVSNPTSARVVNRTQLITMLRGLMVETVGAAIFMGTVGVTTAVELAIAPGPAAFAAYTLKKRVVFAAYE